MTLFENTVLLRGFLGRNAEVPITERVERDCFAVLLVGVVSGTWQKQRCEWAPRTEWHRVICPGPYLCGFVQGMKKGAYVEVTGELHRADYDRIVTVAGEEFPVLQSAYEVYALTVRTLEVPSIGVDEGDDT